MMANINIRQQPQKNYSAPTTFDEHFGMIWKEIWNEHNNTGKKESQEISKQNPKKLDIAIEGTQLEQVKECRHIGEKITSVHSVGVTEAVGALRDFSARGPQLRAYVK